ncbi:MAG TPA: cohesin domain-containing protein, partial [Pirellulales bacterium]|nr:cohesin domain-containing protein [Pirellulales bacterium]
VLSADFTITYDASQLSISNTDVTLSSYLVSQDWGIAKNTTTAGQILLSLYATDQGALPSGTPQLVNLNFHVASNAQAGTSPIGLSLTQNQSINQKGFNEGNLVTSFSNGSVIVPASIANEYIFYNNSKFDSNNSAANSSDYNAIATDKTGLQPGGTASFSNYTSYSRGINGILVDFANLSTSTTLSASDFQFKVGNNNTPSGWANAPAPQTVTTWVGPNGHLFADVVWADNQIQNQWLQITVKADANTHLASDRVFYFGNEIGDTGAANTGTKAFVSAADVSGVQSNPATSLHPSPITGAYDLNRDGLVNAADIMIAQGSLNSSLSPTALTLISPPSAPAALIATGSSQALSMATGASQPATSDAVITAASMPATSTGKTSQAASVDHVFAELKALGLDADHRLESLLESSSDDSWAKSLEADLESLAQHLLTSRSQK